MNTPCILVIEDLDSLVTSQVRSFFLNELDGLVSENMIIPRDLYTNQEYRVKMKESSQ